MWNSMLDNCVHIYPSNLILLRAERLPIAHRGTGSVGCQGVAEVWLLINNLHTYFQPFIIHTILSPGQKQTWISLHINHYKFLIRPVLVSKIPAALVIHIGDFFTSIAPVSILTPLIAFCYFLIHFVIYQFAISSYYSAVLIIPLSITHEMQSYL